MSLTLRKILVAIGIMTLHSVGFAGEKTQDIEVPAGFLVQPGETKDIKLLQPRRIRKIVVSAQAQSSDSMVEVVVNGKVKGTIFAPGVDPSYTVTVEDVTSAIEFKHVSGGALEVLRIQATTSQWTAPDWTLVTPDQTGVMVRDLAATAIEVYENMKLFTSPAEDLRYLLPIKLAAGQVFIMTNAHGPVSEKAGTELRKLAIEIDKSRPFLNDLMKRPETFEDAVNMLTIYESINDLLN